MECVAFISTPAMPRTGKKEMKDYEDLFRIGQLSKYNSFEMKIFLPWLQDRIKNSGLAKGQNIWVDTQ